MSDEVLMLLRLLLACGLGMAVGLERELAGKAAGFRTHTLVCLGAALFTLVSLYAFETDVIGTDISRVAAGVVTGVGFLGAGAILHSDGGIIKGLTTAASIWAVAAIGLTAASGLYWLAGLATALVLLLLRSDRFFKRESESDL